MAHTALGHLEELKKKELVLAAMTMSNEEFDRLVAQRNQLLVESAVGSGEAQPKVTVASTAMAGDNASTDTSGDGGGVAEGDDGL